MANTTLKVTGLKTFYRTRLKENVYAVDGVDLELQEGRVLGIAGESGCGKSTLSTSIMGFYFPPLHYGSGSIEIGGTDIMKLEYEELRTKFLGLYGSFGAKLLGVRLDFFGDLVRSFFDFFSGLAGIILCPFAEGYLAVTVEVHWVFSFFCHNVQC